MGKLREMIPQAVDIVGDLELGFRVWDGVSLTICSFLPRVCDARTDQTQVVAGIKVLVQEATMETEAKPFLAADKWLQGRR